MDAILLSFFSPYISLYSTAHFSFKQNTNSILTEIDQGVAFILIRSMFEVYPSIFIITPFLSVLACFSLRKSAGVVVLFLWLLPGILSILGIITIPINIPDVFYMSSGIKYVGEVGSTLLNVLCMLIFGWSFFTLFVHCFKIYRGFKDAYDHVWYLVGLCAIFIFVVESNASFYQEDLNDYEREIAVNLQTVISQLDFAKLECSTHNDYLKKEAILEGFCRTIDELYRRYSFLVDQKSFARQYHDLSIIGSFINTDFMADAKKFNTYECENLRSSSCHPVPFDTVRFAPEYRYDTNAAIAIAPLHKTLSVLWSESVKLDSKIKSSKKSPNIRWYFYMFLSFIPGGKISNSTRSLAGPPTPKFRISLIKICNWLRNFFRHTNEYSITTFCRLTTFYQRVKKSPVALAYCKWRRNLFRHQVRLKKSVPRYVYVFAAMLCCVSIVFAVAVMVAMPSWLSIAKELWHIGAEDLKSAVWLMLLIVILTIYKSLIFNGPFLLIRAAMGLKTRGADSPLSIIRRYAYQKARKRLWRPLSWLLKP
ncbi:MAG: hypothetical protein EOO53_11780 [Gammaproteobacteria bacterium]|nr:MAG: hypothetical protein EOO53_11780 [Gammaproteobacteria bacterium]